VCLANGIFLSGDTAAPTFFGIPIRECCLTHWLHFVSTSRFGPCSEFRLAVLPTEPCCLRGPKTQFAIDLREITMVELKELSKY
jgi:hypothetical protein